MSFSINDYEWVHESRKPCYFRAKNPNKDVLFFRAFQQVLLQHGYQVYSPQMACFTYEWIRDTGQITLNMKFMARLAQIFNTLESIFPANYEKFSLGNVPLSNTGAAQYYMKTFKEHYGSRTDNRSLYQLRSYDWFIE